MAWTEKMVEDLCIMWNQGLSTAEIGKRLNVSKNSIVGKVHRLGLTARPSPIKKKEDEDTICESPETKTAELEIVKEPLKAQQLDMDIIVKAPSSKPMISQPEDAVKPFVAKPAVVKSGAGNTKLTDLDNHTCRWPIGDPKDENFHFCGRRVRMGQTYCEEHAALAYVKPTNKK